MLEVIGVDSDAHAFSSAAGGGLDHDGIPDHVRLFSALCGVVDRLLRAGDDRNAGLHHRGPGRGLVSHAVDDVRRRADEGQAALLASAHERAVLRKEAVSGMDRVGSHVHRRLDDPVHVQIALPGTALADADPLIGQLYVKGAGVLLGVDGDARNAHVPAGADHAYGDLSPVCDQYFSKHRQ